MTVLHFQGGEYAIVEAKYGKYLSELKPYGGLRQGTQEWIRDRLLKYGRFGSGENAEFAQMLFEKSMTGELRSFAAFRRSSRLYELPANWPTTKPVTIIDKSGVLVWP